MKRDRDQFEGDSDAGDDDALGKCEPGWVDVLLAYDENPETMVNVQDDRLEWDRVSYDPRLFQVPVRYGGNDYVPMATEDRMTALGFMIRTHMHTPASRLLARGVVDVNAPCYWRKGRVYTPAQLTAHIGVACWFETLWSAGVSAHAEAQRRLNELQYMSDSLDACVYMENCMMAVAWVCAQVGKDAWWGDMEEPMVIRMRHVQVDEWWNKLRKRAKRRREGRPEASSSSESESVDN